MSARGAFVSTLNSTSTILGISGAVNGTFEDVSGYTSITVLVKADRDSAAGGLIITQTSDQTYDDHTESYTYLTANGATVYTSKVVGQYAKISFTNGITAHAANGFRLQTLYHTSQNVPGTTGSSLGKAVDSPQGPSDTGVAMLAVRDDALTTLTPVDGDYTQLRVNSTGALYVTGAGGGTQYAADSVSGGTDTGTMALVVRNDVLAPLVTSDGDYAPLQVDADGALYVGNNGTFVTQVTGDALTALQLIDNIVLAEDTAHSSGASGVMSLAVRSDTLAALVDITNDYAPLQVNASGALYVGTNGTFATQVTGDALTALQLIDNIVLAEDAAHSSGASGVMSLAVRNDSLAALVDTDADYAPLQVNASGALYVAPSPNATAASVVKSLDLGDAEVTSASATAVHKAILTNQHATLTRYVKFYDLDSVDPATQAPFATIPVLPQTTVSIDLNVSLATGLSVRATQGIGDTDAVSPNTNDVVVSITVAL